MILTSQSFYPFLLMIASSVVIILLRFAWVIFTINGKVPKIIDFLGKVLPFAMIPILVMYCIKDTKWFEIASVIPTICGIIVTALLHLWKKNTILSLLVGLSTYMILLRIL